MQVYKRANEKQAKLYALPHIKYNHIKCRYYEWNGMAHDTDILTIDGKKRFFNIKTHEEKRIK